MVLALPLTTVRGSSANPRLKSGLFDRSRTTSPHFRKICTDTVFTVFCHVNRNQQRHQHHLRIVIVIWKICVPPGSTHFSPTSSSSFASSAENDRTLEVLRIWTKSGAKKRYGLERLPASSDKWWFVKRWRWRRTTMWAPRKHKEQTRWR